MPKYLDAQGVSFLWRKIKNLSTNNLKYYSQTKQEWDSDLTFISELNVLYIYSNYKTIQKDDQEIIVPGIKIGDGKSFLIDLPFLNGASGFDEILIDHIDSNNIHVSQTDRNFWNNKLNLSLQGQVLTLNRN